MRRRTMIGVRLIGIIMQRDSHCRCLKPIDGFTWMEDETNSQEAHVLDSIAMSARLSQVVSEETEVEKKSTYTIIEAILETGDMSCNICVAWQSTFVYAF